VDIYVTGPLSSQSSSVYLKLSCVDDYNGDDYVYYNAYANSTEFWWSFGSYGLQKTPLGDYFYEDYNYGGYEIDVHNI